MLGTIKYAVKTGKISLYQKRLQVEFCTVTHVVSTSSNRSDYKCPIMKRVVLYAI